MIKAYSNKRELLKKSMMLKKERVPSHSCSKLTFNSPRNSSHFPSNMNNTDALASENHDPVNIANSGSEVSISDTINTHFMVLSAKRSYLKKISPPAQVRERYMFTDTAEQFDPETRKKIEKDVRLKYFLLIF